MLDKTFYALFDEPLSGGEREEDKKVFFCLGGLAGFSYFRSLPSSSPLFLSPPPPSPSVRSNSTEPTQVLWSALTLPSPFYTCVGIACEGFFFDVRLQGGKKPNFSLFPTDCPIFPPEKQKSERFNGILKVGVSCGVLLPSPPIKSRSLPAAGKDREKTDFNLS